MFSASICEASIDDSSSYPMMGEIKCNCIVSHAGCYSVKQHKKTSAFFLSLVVLMVSLAMPAQAQWQKIDLGVTTGFSDVCFLNDDKGFIVGADATCFRTDDGGRTWSKQPIAKTGAFSRIDFADSLHGWVASTSGVFSTRDGGQTWDSISNLAATYLSFVDSRNGWACGNGWISHTTDAGATWNRQVNGLDCNILRIDFFDKSVGCAAGSSGKIYWTNDGGVTWRQCNSPTGNYIYGIQVLSPTTAIGSHEGGGAFRTTNGGVSWKSSPGVAGHGLAVNMDTSGIGFVVGSHGRIQRSTDSGATWNYDVYPSGVTSMYDCIDKYCYISGVFVGPRSAWAVGQGGGVFKRLSIYSDPCTNPSITVEGSSVHCRSGISTFRVSTQESVSILWDLPKKAAVESGSLDDSVISVRWFETGLDTIRVRVTKVEDPTCSRDTFVVAIINASPDSTLTGNRQVCQQSLSMYRVERFAGRAYAWTVSSGGAILGESNRDSVWIAWRRRSASSDTVRLLEAIIESGCVTETLFGVHVAPYVTIAEESDGTLVANVDSAQTFQWLNDQRQPIDGATGVRYKPFESGVYYVVVNQDECIDTSEAHSVTLVSVEQRNTESCTKACSSKSHIARIFPVPAHEYVEVECHSEQSGIVDIVSMDGQRHITFSIERGIGRHRIKLNGLRAGVYLVSLITSKGIDCAPFISLP